MAYREAPLRIVPRVFCEDGGGYARPAKCVHCGESITKSALVWGSLMGDPAELHRPLHRACRREYELFVVALGL